MPPLLREVAHLGHTDLLTPEPEQSLWFFTQVLGMSENGAAGDSIYLRTWDDYEHHSLKLTAAASSGIGRTGLRYYDTERYQPSGADKPALKNQAQAYPGRGVGVRRLDHVSFLAARAEPNGLFVCAALGGRITEQIVLDDGTISAQWLRFAQKAYDLVYIDDWTGSAGRLHHLAFATDSREDILRAADICLDKGVFIETGPHKHAIQQTFFLYVYEPGGDRIELCNPCARLIFAPDWAPVSWTQAERARGQAWGLATIGSFHTLHSAGRADGGGQ
jgi:catechol 2,3-dioxygenase-like lactoylglutathione lyase family enzyme